MANRLKLLVFAFLVLIFPSYNSVQAESALDFLSYEIIDQSVQITGFQGNPVDLVIPAEIDGYPVTSIKDAAFSFCNSLVSITIPEGVIHIGSGAFMSSEKLRNVVLPSTLQDLGDMTFYGCFGLTNITLPEDLKKIGTGTFAYCYRLTSLIIPNSVTSIGDYAFSHCKGLTKMAIPDSVTDMGKAPFEESVQLAAISVSVNNIGFIDIEGVLYDRKAEKLISFPCRKNVTRFMVPEGVNAIGDHAFEGCRMLVDIVIPNSVTSIGDSAFADLDQMYKVTIPEGVASIGKKAFEYCYGLSIIHIPDSVTSIGGGAFKDCPNLSIRCNAGSYAEEFAIKNNIRYKIEDGTKQ